ncbi:MAG: GatB/YqeY domain-containing protein [Bacilli bacterium]|nr:GatB/YqeY domain-containing protein [Bacilli bacterium]MDY6362784.1 GatB/YqeY domain-containing protein [Bacilli bacterium]
MLINELEQANIAALKARDQVTRAVLSVVINRYRMNAIELKSQGKEATDADLVKIISKVIKELDEEKEGNIKTGRLEEAKAIDQQKAVIEKYLPKMMSEDEIRAVIAKLEDKSMPSVMKYFKANYDGQVDMSLVSKIARGQ